MGDQHREQGVELGDLPPKLEGHDFPTAQKTLLSDLGDERIEVGDETTTLDDLLSPLNEDEYRSADEVVQAVMNMVGDDAIGRKHYSDRTPPAPGERDHQDEETPEDGSEHSHQSF